MNNFKIGQKVIHTIIDQYCSHGVRSTAERTCMGIVKSLTKQRAYIEITGSGNRVLKLCKLESLKPHDE